MRRTAGANRPRLAGGEGREGCRRLDNPHDFVRREIALALEHGKKVIPILFDDTQVPPADRLPEPLRALAAIQAMMLRGPELRIPEATPRVGPAAGGVHGYRNRWSRLMRPARSPNACPRSAPHRGDRSDTDQPGLLRADLRWSQFRGRETETSGYPGFVRRSRAVGCAGFVPGSGGAGKHRLWMHACELLNNLAQPTTTEAKAFESPGALVFLRRSSMLAIRISSMSLLRPTRVLLVIDYAETKTDQVKAVLQRAEYGIAKWATR